MEDYNIKDFFNVLILKNQLITLNLEELKEIYQNYDNYLLFLDTFSVLVNIDSGFLFLNDDIIDKVERVINYNRFNTDSDTYDVINEIIQYINLIKGYSSKHKKIFQDSYLAYQEDVRKVKINDLDELLRCLAYDAYMVVAIENGNTDFIEDNILFMSSLNYLVEMVPDILKNPYVYKLMNDHLNSIDLKPLSFKTKKLFRNTQKNYQRIKQKEE